MTGRLQPIDWRRFVCPNADEPHVVLAGTARAEYPNHVQAQAAFDAVVRHAKTRPVLMRAVGR